ncbi:unnamed protein product [Pleuronectes platessa]|uniref:Uncharacterized protein n=1 Tax=Pleuronectes platessa TaxID=8262 RepID=A0A9N7YSQ5_PLEPL|nr:unnamed protein product [Pleuronectes platessa]
MIPGSPTSLTRHHPAAQLQHIQRPQQAPGLQTPHPHRVSFHRGSQQERDSIISCNLNHQQKGIYGCVEEDLP